jgi:glycosyltransferase involved in cell wall biosynthesis
MRCTLNIRNMIKFSIITSLYNSQNFLDKYFSVIFSQKLKPDEIILIDDTSNSINLNETIEKVKNFYNFDKIYLIRNEENLGPALSLNKGIRICKNDLIFRLDVDDHWEPEHTSEMIGYYCNDNSYLIYANSLRKRDFLTNLKCDDYLINENHLIHSSWLINRGVCKNFRYHMLRPNIGLEDYFTLLYYSKKFSFFFNYSNNVLYLNNINSHGKNSRKHKNYYKIRKKISRIFFYRHIKNLSLVNKLYFIFFKLKFYKFIIFIILYSK